MCQPVLLFLPNEIPESDMDLGIFAVLKQKCFAQLAIVDRRWYNQNIRRFIEKSNKQTKDEIERLIAGEAIAKEIKQELTYNELDKTIDHLWSVLFTTGYLTQRGREEGRKYLLAIPNLEIRELFITQIREWFRDTAVKKEKKEHFYHGILLGLLSHKENWLVRSNAESGEGYSDILVEVPETKIGVVIELKYAQEGKMDAACEEALRQIEEKQYAAKLECDGMQTIVKFGIACYKKHCKVVLG